MSGPRLSFGSRFQLRQLVRHDKAGSVLGCGIAPSRTLIADAQRLAQRVVHDPHLVDRATHADMARIHIHFDDDLDHGFVYPTNVTYSMRLPTAADPSSVIAVFAVPLICSPLKH